MFSPNSYTGSLASGFLGSALRHYLLQVTPAWLLMEHIIPGDIWMASGQGGKTGSKDKSSSRYTYILPSLSQVPDLRPCIYLDIYGVLQRDW